MRSVSLNFSVWLVEMRNSCLLLLKRVSSCQFRGFFNMAWVPFLNWFLSELVAIPASVRQRPTSDRDARTAFECTCPPHSSPTGHLQMTAVTSRDSFVFQKDWFKMLSNSLSLTMEGKRNKDRKLWMVFGLNMCLGREGGKERTEIAFVVVFE